MGKFLKLNLWSGVGVALGMGAVISHTLIHQQATCACADSSLALLSTVTRLQQAHFVESSFFLEDNQAIAKQIGERWQSDPQYQFQTRIQKQFAYAFATPYPSTDNPLKSSVAAIAAHNGNLVTVLCQSTQPSDRPLDLPSFDGITFTCPPNTKIIN